MRASARFTISEQFRCRRYWAFGAEPLFGLLIYAGASLVVSFVLGISLFGLAGAGETAAFLIFFAFLGLRFYLSVRRQKVQAVIQRRLGEIGNEVGEYVGNAGTVTCRSGNLESLPYSRRW